MKKKKNHLVRFTRPLRLKWFKKEFSLPSSVKKVLITYGKVLTVTRNGIRGEFEEWFREFRFGSSGVDGTKTDESKNVQ